MIEGRFGAIRAALKGDDGEALSKKSLDELKTMAAATPKNYSVQMALGRALRKGGDVEGAAKAFEAAAALITISPTPHGQLAQIALEKKDRPRAIAELEAVVA